jgi:hypothetical protein
MGRNRGYFILPRVSAAGIRDTIQNLVSYFRNLRLDTDQVVIKYRKTDRFGMPVPLAITGSATWTSSTVFTVDSTTHAVQSLEEGDEIEVVKGAGAGYTAHITTIDKTSSIWSVTIDEELPISSGSFDFIAQNWTKLATLTNASTDNTRNFAQKSIGKETRWLETKIELRGREVEIDAVAITNALKQPI